MERILLVVLGVALAVIVVFEAHFFRDYNAISASFDGAGIAGCAAGIFAKVILSIVGLLLTMVGIVVAIAFGVIDCFTPANKSEEN